ncbi:unnamed protein product [Spirodela intermedia]|uniref:Uncharacterized protein n=1 Tax=Spirodela intermedia TaxID=51605 RepID=A0A7I8KVK0_SPIIN|nr:unnamed protein product [Spirodela intermedia]
MSDEDPQIWRTSKRKVLGEMSNTCAKRGHPLVPGKFLIGNDKIRKQEPAGVGPEDPAARKRVIGELVNVIKGKQRFNWASENSGAMAGDRSSISWAPFPLRLFCPPADLTGTIDQNREAPGQKYQPGLASFSGTGNRSIEFVNLAENVSQEDDFIKSQPASGHPEQQSSGRTTGLPEEPGKTPGANVHENLVAGKGCSCPLCLKAGYLWADLLYQDCKGRLLEVNRSRRDARLLTGSSSSHDLAGRAAGNDEKSARLESELRQHWRALFVHTESVLTCESAQLQSSLLKLKELRENCKRDAEAETPSVVPNES